MFDVFSFFISYPVGPIKHLYKIGRQYHCAFFINMMLFFFKFFRFFRISFVQNIYKDFNSLHPRYALNIY